MRFHLLSLMGAILLISGCGPVPDPKELVGKSAPDFEVQSLQSQSLKATLASLKGKPVILDFWATYCGPCKTVTPLVEKIYQDYRKKGLMAMAITDENRKDVQAFEAATPHEMPVYLDPNDVANFAYHVPDKGIPTIVVVDRNGMVVYDETGYAEGQLGLLDVNMRNAVEKALGSS